METPEVRKPYIIWRPQKPAFVTPLLKAILVFLLYLEISKLEGLM